MKKHPQSLLAAAKEMAEILGIPWADFFKYYRDLQIEPTFHEKGKQVSPHAWLPKSQGRNIWPAQPNFISRLLCAVAGTENPSAAREAVEWTRDLTPNGRAMYAAELPAAGMPAPIEEVFQRYLVDIAAAKELDYVEFRPDDRQIIFHKKDGSLETYAHHTPIGQGKRAPAQPYKGLTRRGIIDGMVFFYLANQIDWRRYDQAPFYKGVEDEDA